MLGVHVSLVPVFVYACMHVIMSALWVFACLHVWICLTNNRAEVVSCWMWFLAQASQVGGRGRRALLH